MQWKSKSVFFNSPPVTVPINGSSLFYIAIGPVVVECALWDAVLLLFQPEKPLKEVRKGRAAKAVEVEEEQEVESPARSRRTGKNRSYSEFYDQ